MTIDILICSFNKGIVRIDDVLLPPRPDVRYIVSYQYNDERYLDLIPAALEERSDVLLYKYHGQGLSANRNMAIEKATADLLMFADDDTHILPEALERITAVFDAAPTLDVAFFRASTYTGKLLKNYPDHEMEVKALPDSYAISTIEMVCRRKSVQGVVRFDERFGLGTKFLTCGEEEIWLQDALSARLTMHYYPIKTVETSTMLKKSMIYVDAGVQRSRGAQTYYIYGQQAWWRCFRFALKSATARLCHFWPMMRHLCEGIRYMQRTS
jgi:glycosyltransferase involved in cell wall biosynthesis